MMENKDDEGKSLLKTARFLFVSAVGALGALVHFEKPELTTKDMILGAVFGCISVVALGFVINDTIKLSKKKKGQKNAHKLVQPKKQEPTTKDTELGCISEWIAAAEIESMIDDAIKKRAHKKKQKNAHKDDGKEI